LSASAANAVTVSIAFQAAGENGGAITQVGPSATDSLLTFNGSYGDFTSSVTASGSPPLIAPDVLDSTSLNITSHAAATLNVYVTVSDITAPLGDVSFLSGLTSNVLPVSWSVTLATFIDANNGKFTTTTPLSSFTFNTIGTSVQSAVANTGLDAYSLTALYTITSGRIGGQALSTIHVSAVPGPVVGAGLPGLVIACGALIAFARRRRKKAAQV
jgi:hypothetical protein